MHTALAPRPAIARFAYASIAASLVAAIAFEIAAHGTGYWQLAAFGLGADLALFFGAGNDLAKGQLHPRAVPLYNLLHRFWLPIGVLVLASFGVIGLGFVVGGLAWCFHISLDRAVGYGLRTRDGFQRS